MFGQRREYACFRDEGQLLISELPFFNFFNSMLKKEWLFVATLNIYICINRFW